MDAEARRREALIDLVYRSADDDAVFANLCRTVAEYVGADQAGVSVRRGIEILDISIDLHVAGMSEYLAYYYKIDPWTPRILALTSGQVAMSHEMLPDRVVRNSEFFTDYASRFGVEAPMCGRIDLEPGVDLTIGLNRLGARFDEGHRQRAIEILSHLRRAMQMRRRLQSRDGGAVFGLGALEALTFGVALADGEGRLLFANPALEALARGPSGLKIKAGRLIAANAAEGEALAELVFNAASAKRVGACLLSGTSGQPALAVLVLPADRSREPTRAQPHALLSISPLHADSGLAPNLFKHLFKLTPTESEIVAALWAGDSAAELAANRGVKPTTLKTQLDAIYRKTGAANQRALMRLVGQLPQVRYPA